MRRCYLVCYDIRDPKRLRKVYRTMKGFGESWQYSVFYAVLGPLDRARMENRLREAVNLRLDQVLIVDLGGDDGAAREAAVVLGQGLPGSESGVVVV